MVVVLTNDTKSNAVRHDQAAGRPCSRTPFLSSSRVPKTIREWHSLEPEGWFGLDHAEQKVKLEELAQYFHELIALFTKRKVLRAS